METTKQQQRGISLLEVLAALFVVSIGLLGVLAVIPFGAFQVSKAQHAEYASNLLANAAEEIVIREMAKPTSWEPARNTTLDCTRFVWIEPHKSPGQFTHIESIQAIPAELMRGQDDLLYTLDGTDRPQFTKPKDGDGNELDKVQSSGNYTWFFTFLPQATDDFDGNLTAVPLAGIKDKTTVDVFACYKRVPEDDVQASDCVFSPSFGGGSLEFSHPGYGDHLSATKYVLVTWEIDQKLHGAWCKIVFLDRSIPKAVVTGGLPDADTVYNNMRVYIPNGVLYHKRVENVSVR